MYVWFDWNHFSWAGSDLEAQASPVFISLGPNDRGPLKCVMTYAKLLTWLDFRIFFFFFFFFLSFAIQLYSCNGCNSLRTQFMYKLTFRSLVCVGQRGEFESP